MELDHHLLPLNWHPPPVLFRLTWPGLGQKASAIPSPVGMRSGFLPLSASWNCSGAPFSAYIVKVRPGQDPRLYLGIRTSRSHSHSKAAPSSRSEMKSARSKRAASSLFRRGVFIESLTPGHEVASDRHPHPCAIYPDESRVSSAC